MQRVFSQVCPTLDPGQDAPEAADSRPPGERTVDFTVLCRNDAGTNVGGTGCVCTTPVENIRRKLSVGCLEGYFAMNNWVLAAILAVAALAMYVGIFVKMGG